MVWSCLHLPSNAATSHGGGEHGPPKADVKMGEQIHRRPMHRSMGWYLEHQATQKEHQKLQVYFGTGSEYIVGSQPLSLAFMSDLRVRAVLHLSCATTSPFRNTQSSIDYYDSRSCAPMLAKVSSYNCRSEPMTMSLEAAFIGHKSKTRTGNTRRSCSLVFSRSHRQRSISWLRS